MSLESFLAAAERTPFAYGVWDCCLWLADWLIATGRPDPAAALRGRYRTALGCTRLLARGGGVVAVVGRCATLAGLAATDAPLPGDVGVIETVGERGVARVGALRARGDWAGGAWAVLGESGLIYCAARPIAAWRV